MDILENPGSWEGWWQGSYSYKCLKEYLQESVWRGTKQKISVCRLGDSGWLMRRGRNQHRRQIWLENLEENQKQTGSRSSKMFSAKATEKWKMLRLPNWWVRERSLVSSKSRVGGTGSWEPRLGGRPCGPGTPDQSPARPPDLHGLNECKISPPRDLTLSRDHSEISCLPGSAWVSLGIARLRQEEGAWTLESDGF